MLIDEGHDFEPEWLKLVVQMVDPETNALLLLYDDAQSIYKTRAGLGFTLSSVGVQAQGRTTVLRLNYRNTREILAFAYEFAKSYLAEQSADEDHVPLIVPEAAGSNGPVPVVRRLDSHAEEIAYAVAALKKWHGQGVPWNEMAVLCLSKYQGRDVSRELGPHEVPHRRLEDKRSKSEYDPAADEVVVSTIHSSKGLEFSRVIMLGIGRMGDEAEKRQQDVRLLYVGMTRAQECLLLTVSGDNEFTRRIEALAEAVG